MNSARCWSAWCCVLVLSAWCGVLGAGCARGDVSPEPLTVGQDVCEFCRMTVSQPQFASQLLVDGELPKFFDDLGCLHAYMTGTAPTPDGGVAFVTDHRTREWVRADRAVYARVPSLSTPMASHLVAHAIAASREADTDVTATEPATLDNVVPPQWRQGQEP